MRKTKCFTLNKSTKIDFVKSKLIIKTNTQEDIFISTLAFLALENIFFLSRGLKKTLTGN